MVWRRLGGARRRGVLPAPGAAAWRRASVVLDVGADSPAWRARVAELPPQRSKAASRSADGTRSIMFCKKGELQEQQQEQDVIALEENVAAQRVGEVGGDATDDVDRADGVQRQERRVGGLVQDVVEKLQQLVQDAQPVVYCLVDPARRGAAGYGAREQMRARGARAARRRAARDEHWEGSGGVWATTLCRIAKKRFGTDTE